MYKIRGTIGEQRAVYDLLSADCEVFTPVVDSEFDLLIRFDNVFYTVECKTSEHTPCGENTVSFDVSRTMHSNSRITSITYGDNIDFLYFWTPKYPNISCLVPRNMISGKQFTIYYGETKKQKSQNIFSDFSCVETLHHTSRIRDEEKVQTTNS